MMSESSPGLPAPNGVKSQQPRSDGCQDKGGLARSVPNVELMLE